MLAVVAAAVRHVWLQWDSVRPAISSLSLWSLVAAFIAVFLGVLLCSVIWKVVLTDLGAPVTYREAGEFYLVGGLGKYIPGSVWAVVLAMELAHEAGVSRARSFAAGLVTTGISVVAALIVGVAALPVVRANESARELYLLFPVLVVGLVCLHPTVLGWLVNTTMRLLRKPALPHPFTALEVAKATLVGIAVYSLYGFHLWLLTTSFGVRDIDSLVLFVGAMGLAMAAGLFAFFLPSGIGAREIVIVAAVATVVPHGTAVAVALVSRIMFTVSDLVAAGLAAAVVKLRRPTGQADGAATLSKS